MDGWKNAGSFDNLESIFSRPARYQDTTPHESFISCSTCGNQVIGGEIEEFLIWNNFSVKLEFLQCIKCKKYVSVWCCDDWRDVGISDFFHSSDKHPDGSFLVEHPKDVFILFLLSQICHNQYDLDDSMRESPFHFPGSRGVSKIMWKNNEAVGFYNVKVKGTSFNEGSSLAYFSIHVIDCIYIRKSFRRCGLATKMVMEVLEQFSDEDVAFSQPISDSPMHVIHRLLTSNLPLRRRLWACQYNGEAGYRSNIYFAHLAKKRKEAVQ